LTGSKLASYEGEVESEKRRKEKSLSKIQILLIFDDSSPIFEGSI